MDVIRKFIHKHLQVTVIDLLFNLTVNITTAYSYPNGTLMGLLTAADTVNCPLPLLPRITNVTFTINTVRGKIFCCAFVNTDRRLGGLLFGDIHGRQQCAGELQSDRRRQRTKQCHQVNCTLGRAQTVNDNSSFLSSSLWS